ncbi:hypothetical protein [Streptomyces sp. NPDC048603]|uniref:hypothetical protein n=1 Tax=Streptomyces sp. NPDC048603 TaxID=3365577 RepID=UPI003718BA55
MNRTDGIIEVAHEAGQGAVRFAYQAARQLCYPKQILQSQLNQTGVRNRLCVSALRHADLRVTADDLGLWMAFGAPGVGP